MKDANPAVNKNGVIMYRTACCVVWGGVCNAIRFTRIKGYENWIVFSPQGLHPIYIQFIA